MSRSPRVSRLLSAVLLGSVLCALPLLAIRVPAVEPGVDIAVPRVAVTTVASALAFNPPRLAIEQGDHVRWTPLVTSVHTTTSGMPCLADGLWNASLGTIGVSFTRQFLEPPGTFSFFCSPHCGLGMTGQVVVTTLIDLRLNDGAGTAMLNWSGGSGSYQVFRSDNPAFTGTGTVRVPPDGGSTGISLADVNAPPPAAGAANFYLVMNLF